MYQRYTILRFYRIGWFNISTSFIEFPGFKEIFGHFCNFCRLSVDGLMLLSKELQMSIFSTLLDALFHHKRKSIEPYLIPALMHLFLFLLNMIY